jgi:hypothetical protein
MSFYEDEYESVSEEESDDTGTVLGDNIVKDKISKKKIIDLSINSFLWCILLNQGLLNHDLGYLVRVECIMLCLVIVIANWEDLTHTSKKLKTKFTYLKDFCFRNKKDF